MRSAWLITNPASGSTSDAQCAAIEAALVQSGQPLAGRTHFPCDPLPRAADLRRAGVDTAVLFAGDGTINAALSQLADWPGDFLILPGGTMNLLALRLHGSATPLEIVQRIDASAQRHALPYIQAGSHRAFVAAILGPAARWGRAREAVRDRRPGAMIRAIGAAWRRSFGPGVGVRGVPRLDGRYQAIFVKPDENSLQLSAIDARDLQAIVELGWDFLTGDWVDARAVECATAATVRLAGTKPVVALFDGEPVRIDPGTPIGVGRTRPAFIATAQEPA